MRLRILPSLLILLAAAQFDGQSLDNAKNFTPASRSFHFTYKFTVKDMPADPCMGSSATDGSASNCTPYFN